MIRVRDTYEKDEIHDRWEAVYRGNPLQDRFNDRIMHRIMKYLRTPPNALFLDAGCGSGDHTVRIARTGCRCIGVDVSEKILRRAKARISETGLSSRVSLTCQALEDLAFASNSFDAIHCRGVLMHIPAWEKALEQLIRVLKPGGRIAILELNHQSLESWIVRQIRRFLATQSRMVETEAGLEFWSDEGGKPWLARVANLRRLAQQLRHLGVEMNIRKASEFWDINRFPAGVLRNAIIRFNVLWFLLGLPARVSSGNLILGEKHVGGPGGESARLRTRHLISLFMTS
jgi:ubiquinone/menaquinone biosynthesis C-methylase UbiE